MINGSPHDNGANYTALHEMEMIFKTYDIEIEIIHVGQKGITGCMACDYCLHHGKGCTDKFVNEVAKKFETADGLVISSPVYYASANATLIAFLDKLFYSSQFDKTMKVGASVVTLRRGGASATYDELNKYFSISGMPIATSQYWNSVHGNNAKQAIQDIEGLQTMRILARNMAFLMHCIKLGKQTYGLPNKEEGVLTNFIR